MTVETLGRAVHKARHGAKIVFVTKTSPTWLIGFLGKVTNPSRIQHSMRKAHWKGGGWLIVTDKVDEVRMASSEVMVIKEDDCHLEEYATYLADLKGVS